MDIRKTSFFEAPDFYLSDWEGVNRTLDSVKVGEVWEIGRSQGGHPIRAVAYGAKEPMTHSTPFHASRSGGHPEDYYDPAQRTKPVFTVISSYHAAEIEGCVSCMNLISIMETGADLRGRRWDALREVASAMRVVMVPLAQPDGRIRIGIRNLLGGTVEDLYYYGQGVRKNGEILWWPECFRTQPLPLEEMTFIGGYYNDAGVNLGSDRFFAADMAPETRALFDLVADETPDCTILLHSCEEGPFFTGPDSCIPQAYQFRQTAIAAIVGERHRRDGLKPELDRVIKTGPRGSFNLQGALYTISGTLPLLLEFPHGLEQKPFTFDEILDVGLTMFEEVMRFGLTYGFRPPDHLT